MSIRALKEKTEKFEPSKKSIITKVHIYKQHSYCFLKLNSEKKIINQLPRNCGNDRFGRLYHWCRGKTNSFGYFQLSINKSMKYIFPVICLFALWSDLIGLIIPVNGLSPLKVWILSIFRHLKIFSSFCPIHTIIIISHCTFPLMARQKNGYQSESCSNCHLN